MEKIIFVSHSAHPNGAEFLALSIIQELIKHEYEVFVLLKTEGILESKFFKLAHVYNLYRDYHSIAIQKNLIEVLKMRGVKTAICNTALTGDIAWYLSNSGIPSVTLIHELPGAIKKFDKAINADLAAQYSDKLIFPSNFVFDKFYSFAPFNIEKKVIMHQGLYKDNQYKHTICLARDVVRKEFKIPDSGKIILGVGPVSYHKGTDLFVEIAKKIIKDHKEFYFLWVGDFQTPFYEKNIPLNNEVKDNVIFTGLRDDIDLLYSGSDLFLLTSREDSYPSTLIESMNVGLPVIGFHDAGGFSDLITDKTGSLVPFLDIESMSSEIIRILSNENLLSEIRQKSPEIIEKNYNFSLYVETIIDILESLSVECNY